jgi:proteic killer suppression protein
MKIRNFAHKGLRRLYAEDGARGVSPDTADKLRKMLAFLDNMEDPEELRALMAWKAHTLTGDRAETWSLRACKEITLPTAVVAHASACCGELQLAIR